MASQLLDQRARHLDVHPSDVLLANIYAHTSYHKLDNCMVARLHCEYQVDYYVFLHMPC